MRIIVFTAVAGIGGTGLGGLISIFAGKRSPLMISCVLAFASGVMTSVVCFGLIPESNEVSGPFVTVLGLILGVIVIMALNKLVDAATDLKGEKLRIHQTHDELFHEKQLLNSRISFLKSGVLMLCAIGLHNIPEGLAIGAGASHDSQLGVMLALIIALHNVPEGIAIASPLLAGGLRRRAVLVLTALSGAPTVIGGLFGILMGNISDTTVSLSLALAGGAMLYVVFGEIIPQSIVMTKNRIATVSVLFGTIVGFLITQI